MIKSVYIKNFTTQLPWIFFGTSGFKILYLFFLFILSGITYAQSPSWVWAKDVHTSGIEFATDIAVDTTNGNVVAVGTYTGNLSTTSYGPALSTVGGGFVTKYAPNGNVLWAFSIGNNADDGCNGVAVSPIGNIYVTGYFENIADFKGTLLGPSTILTSSGGKDMFIAKYNSAGQLLWVKQGGGVLDDEGLSVCTNLNNIFVTGYFTNSGNFSGIPTASNRPNENIFVDCYDTNGAIQWLTDAGSGQSCFGRGIVADNNGVYVTGDFKNSTLFVYDYNGLFASTLSNSNSATGDIFVMSIAVTGPFNWIKPIQSNGEDLGNGIAQNSAGIYVTGATSANANFPGYVSNPVAVGASGLDIFIAQIKKTTGATLWVNSEPGANDQIAFSVCVDTSNLICIAGAFHTGINFNSGTSITSTGNEDVFVAAYSTTGVMKWATQAGDLGSDVAFGIASSSTGEIYTGGAYQNNAVFGANTLTADFLPNIFVAKLGCLPVSNNTVSSAQTICANQIPATLIGSVPSGGSSTYGYFWEQSPDNLSWSPASGTNNTQNYSPPALTVNTYYRRTVISSGASCGGFLTSTSILISVDQQPTVSIAGIDSSICTNTITMFANTPTVGIGTWTLVSGAGTITSINSPTTTINSLGTGLNIFAWTITNGVCLASSDTLTIKVSGLPTTSNAGSPQNICSSTAILNGNNPIVGSGIWTVLSGGSTVTSPAQYNSGVTGLAIGANTFMWTISNGACTSSSSTVSINVSAMPSVSNAGANQIHCNTTIANLNAVNPAVGMGAWTVLSGGSTVTTPSLYNSGVTSLAVGMNTFMWTVSNGSCPVSTSTVSIRIDALPSSSLAGSPQTICSATTTLAGNNPVIGTGAWTVLSGGSTVISPTQYNSGVTTLAIGANTFMWTITNGVCPSSTSTVAVNVDANPSTATAGSPQTICSSTAAFSANIPAVGTGSWSLVSGTGIVTPINSAGATVSGLSTGANIFMWAISNGTCPASTSTVAINVNANPTTSSAGSPQTICSTTATLNGNNPIVGTGAWTVLSGGSTVTSPSQFNSGVTNLTVGSNTFMWTITNGVCPSSTSTVAVNVDANPSTANAGSSQTICSSTAAFSANIPTVGTGAWSLVSGTGIVTPINSAGATVSGLSTGANIFMWAISNGTCPASTSTVAINVSANPTISSAGSPQTICSTTAMLNGNNPIVGTGAWTVLSGGSTVTSPSQFNSSVTNLAVGSNTFMWTITNGVCPSSTNTVTINVDAMPSIANAGAPQNVCAYSTLLNAVVPSVGTGLWSVVSGGATIALPSANNTSVTVLSTGMNIFMWTVSNGTCPSSTSTVSILADTLPSVANAGLSQIVCISTVNLSANIPTSGTGGWSVITGTATVSSTTSSNSSVTNLSNGTNIFMWTITNGTCPSSSDTVTIFVNAPPSKANAGPDQKLCSLTSANLSGNNPLIGSGIWSVITGTATLANANLFTSAVNNLQIGLNTFVWTTSNNGCASSSDTLNITVYVNPTIANAGTDQILFILSTNLTGNIPVTGTGVWSVVSGSGNFANSSNPITAVTNLQFGQNIIRWTISNGVCPASSDDVIITVNELSIPNGFSPNSDGTNDNFEIPGLLQFTNVKLEVFNRWGNLVYENLDYKNNWNGKNNAGEYLSDDTYFYTLEITGKKTYKGFVMKKSGD